MTVSPAPISRAVDHIVRKRRATKRKQKEEEKGETVRVGGGGRKRIKFRHGRIGGQGREEAGEISGSARSVEGKYRNEML